MSFTSGTNSAGSASLSPQGTLGDVPPVTFPGVASGIDYNAIILKYTQATQAAEVPYQDQINNLNSANAEVLKLQNLLGSVQDSLTALSTLSTFQAYTATPSVTGVATGTQISGQNAVAGTYTIKSQVAATATQIVNDSAANATLTPGAETGTAIANIGASVTPTNGTNPDGTPATNGTVTINGVQISWNTTESLSAIISSINSAGAGVTATFNSGTGTVTLAATTSAGIALGSASDLGNLVQVLHLDTAQDVGSGASETITSSSPIVGINQFATLGGTGNAGFATAVTSGTFTINGVQLTINASTQSVNNIINLINGSAAGVSASFNTNTDNIVLTNNTPGNQNIVLGSGSDTSNFLGVSGLSTATGLNPTTTIGTQASLTYVGPTGSPVTVYSSTNDFTSVIPGIDLKLASSTTTPYTVTVANDPTAAEKAIGTFVTAYNAALVELNKATQPPQVATSTNASTGQQQATQATTGGVLYKNFEVANLRNQLVQIVSGLIPSGSSSYNSLQSIGLKLDTSSVSTGTLDASDTTTQTDASPTSNLTSTSGQLAALDTTTFAAALAANPSAVQALFTSTAGGLAQSLGAQLTIATGLPTFLSSGLADAIPTQSLLNTVEDTNQLQIDALKLQVNQINDGANAQANLLRAEFTASETQIAQLQALQQQIAAIGH